MLTTKETEGVNSNLAQFEDLVKSKYNIKFILDKINNINCRVAATNYLQSHSVKLLGSTALHFALSHKDLEAFDILLNHGADLTIKNSNGSTAFHQIVEDRKCFTYSDRPNSDHTFIYLVVSAHVKYRNYENPVNPNGLSHFHIACAANNVDVVKGFLQHGICVDHTVNKDSPLFPGFSPLHFAVKYYAFEVAEVLLSYSANVHVENAKGITPLHIILEQKLNLISNFNLRGTLAQLTDKFEKILIAFLEKVSKDDLMVVEKWGLSQFHVACTLNDSKIIENLLPRILNINHSVNMDSPSCPGYTALHFAALCNKDTVKLLIPREADFSAKDAKGITPLDMCSKQYRAEDIYEIISLNPVWKNIMLSDGRTRLTDLVFAMRNPEQFDLFVKKLAKDINIPNSPLWPGYTPVHLAVLFSKKYNIDVEEDELELNQEILIILHKHNPAMLHMKDVNGRTPIHLAFHLRKAQILSDLLDQLASHPILIDQVDEDGLSYLHIAAASEKPYLVKRLLSTPANVNAVYRGLTLLPPSMFFPTIYTGSTPLHFAVANRSLESAQILIEQGADVHAKDANDMTPIHLLLFDDKACNILESPNLKDSVVSGIGLSHLHIASLCCKPEIVKRLLDDGANVNGVITCKPIANISPCQLYCLERYDGCSPLLVAYKKDNYRVVEVLLTRGADGFVKNTKGMVFLHRIIDLNSKSYFNLFTKILINRVDVQTHLKVDVGMTELHIACITCISNEIGKLLSEGADFNARIPVDSPIFQGYTPLHVVIHVSNRHNDSNVEHVIKILVKAGADVTVPNAKSETAIHSAWNSFNRESDGKDKSKYIRVNVLLEAQRDFSANPANIGGISHFHIACHFCNVGIVQKFLSHGKVDINQAIDFFVKDFPGYSPLHLAAGSQSSFCGASKQLRTVDLLLNHGSNVHAEDAHGDTALHECARFNSLDIFERIVRDDADVNARNVWGNTPLYCYLSSSKPSVEGLKVLLRFGCHLNVFNAITGDGYMGAATCKLPYVDMQNFLDTTIINFKQDLQADNLDRTIIHNIVSTDSPEIPANQYATLIEQTLETDCDVDRQDNSESTALHMAVQFYNFKGVIALLMTGADINVTDVNGKTPFAHEFNECQRCKYQDNNMSWYDDEEEKTCEHLMTLEALAFHVKKLQLCGLHVDKQNEDLARKAFDRLNNENAQSKKFLGEVEMIKSIRIEPHDLTLNDFLSENGAVADYPTMSKMKREDINKFFSSSKVGSISEKFPEVAGILLLQYRKARARAELVELAKNAMELLIGFRLPEICSQIVMLLLTNSELKNLIASMI